MHHVRYSRSPTASQFVDLRAANHHNLIHPVDQTLTFAKDPFIQVATTCTLPLPLRILREHDVRSPGQGGLHRFKVFAP